MHVQPYLYFDGNCEEAFKFYEKCFNAKIQMMMTHEGSPVGNMGGPEWAKKILHASPKIGDTVLSASDAPPNRLQQARWLFRLTERQERRGGRAHLQRALSRRTGSHGSSGDFLGASLRNVQRPFWNSMDDQLRKTYAIEQNGVLPRGAGRRLLQGNVKSFVLQRPTTTTENVSGTGVGRNWSSSDAAAVFFPNFAVAR